MKKDLLDELAARVEEAWPKALAQWSPYLLISRPIVQVEQKSIAEIDLSTRQVKVNGPMIIENDLSSSLEAILSHEIGHHLRYPATLQSQARLVMLERSLAPTMGGPIVNLFTDLMINHELGDRFKDDLAKIYVAFRKRGDAKPDTAFMFYLAIYEALWGFEDGSLIGTHHPVLVRAHPGYRDDAQALADNLFNLDPNLYTQFIYFISIIKRYLPDSSDLSERALVESMSCGDREPSPDDWADAMLPDKRQDEAIDRAVKEGWVEESRAEGARRHGPDANIGRVRDLDRVMAAYYRREAARRLISPPPVPSLADPLVPTTIEDWEQGDPLSAIDWITTARARGELSGVMPLRRELEAGDDVGVVPAWQVRLEIYLDVSASMPDPKRALNAMTLGALILAIAAIRKGGWVRALVYSSCSIEHWKWSRSEDEVSRFLMSYIGQGTEFPFATLERSIDECGPRQPIRVVISDIDFHHNVAGSGVTEEIIRRASPDPGFILVLHHVHPSIVDIYRGLGARVVSVDDMRDIPKAAADLSRALFGGRQHGSY